MKIVISEIGLFLKKHWVHLLLGFPMLIGWTILHELAHCIAVWCMGGTVTEFVWLPSAHYWGHMRYLDPGFSPFMDQLVSLAPYIGWTIFCLVALVLSLRGKGWSFAVASTIYVWLFIFPVADTANAAVPYLLWGMDNDFYAAFGEPALWVVFGMAVYGLLIVLLGYWLNQRLYKKESLGVPVYCVLVGIAVAFVVGVTWGR